LYFFMGVLPKWRPLQENRHRRIPQIKNGPLLVEKAIPNQKKGATMPRFHDGDDVAHKTDKGHRMTVIRSTSDGKVICRWKKRIGFKTEEFLEVELENWTRRPPRQVFRG
jgi:uncharacterized protein YodC (DUF2158 family)